MAPNRPAIAQLIAAYAFVILVCAGLGAFSGCNLGLEATARGVQVGSRLIFVGMGAGLVIGLAVSVWDKSLTKQPASIWRRFALRFGYAAFWLLLAIIPFRAGRDQEAIYTPVSVPIRFDKENTASATFTADQTAIYVVQIAVKPNLPDEDLNAFIGGWPYSDAPSHRGPPRPEIFWTVNDPEADRSSYWKGDYPRVVIGQFGTIAGHRYTVTAHVAKPSPAAQVLDPQLQVALSSDFWFHYYIPDMIAQTGRVIGAVVGTILLIRSLEKLWSERREAIAVKSEI